MMIAVKSRGFTLIEMMLAIMVFGLLSMMSTQIFKSTVNNNEIVQRKVTDMTSIQRTLSILERDFGQILVRQGTDATRPNLNDFSWTPATSPSGEGFSIAFLRGNWLNPEERLSRSSLERVRYRISAGSLVRQSVADSPLQQPDYVNSVTLLTGITTFRIRFWQGQEWGNSWNSGLQPPEAIEVTFGHNSLGEVRRVILGGGVK